MPTKDTTKLLLRMRELMRSKQIHAYIVPSSDAHGSEYLAEKDKRRQFICGMKGSAGTAVLTDKKALLWTDSRYYLQATQQLDSNWTLMKDGLPETPTIGDWLGKNLPTKSLVGVDATLYSQDLFESVSQSLKASNSKLIHVEENLVDVVRSEEEKLEFEYKPLTKLSLEHVGERTSEKIQKIRSHLSEVNAEAIVIRSLNEIAWVLNLRGNDVPYGTVFFASLIITTKSTKLFTKLDRIEEFKDYLLNEDPNFEFYDYQLFFPHFAEYIESEIQYNDIKTKVLLSGTTSHAVFALIPEEFVLKEASYVDKLKVVKNESEIESAIKVHLRDSVVLVELFHKALTQFDPNWDEYNFAEMVNEYRAKAEGFMCPSFETICSIGANGAVIHYKPEMSSSKKLELDNILLVDSGGHYYDMGTTDVTRTVYLGDCAKIDAYQKECFTRVLKGHIQLAMRVFPIGIKSELLDSFARSSLWQVGLDYKHGNSLYSFSIS